MDLTELTGAAGLLLMTILGGSDLCDSLAVRYLRSEELNLETELVIDSPLDGVDVLLAVSAEDGLTEFLAVFYDDGRILRGDLLQGLAELLLVLLYLCLDGATVFRSGVLDLLEVQT